MRTVYLGGTRGCRSAYYKPGHGWTGAEDRRRFGRNRPVMTAASGARLSPLAVAQPRRPGVATRAFILVIVAVVFLAMAVVLGGLSLL